MKKFFFLALSLYAGLAVSAQSLEKWNEGSPMSRPCTWWHWLDCNVTRQGITADLEAMSRAGYHEAQIFNVGYGYPEGTAKYLSHEWLELFKWAAIEAKRVGMELCFHNGPGWSSSGGFWVKPEQSMQRVVWTETNLTGTGKKQTIRLEQPKAVRDWYEDIIVLAFVHISGKPKDKSHDYGHGKYETLAMTVIGFMLLAVALGIIYGGLMKIIAWSRGELLPAPGMLALLAALLSIVLKEGVFHYTIVKAKELESQALEANAWHHRSDALSSIGTAIGIGGAIFLGQRWTVLDPLASVIVGLFIAKVSIDLLRGGLGDLMEQSLPDEVEQEILQLAGSVEGVEEPHDLRTRRIGNHYAIELHILMDGNVPLLVAHDRASEVEERLRKRYGEETHVVVHVEPIS